MQKLGLVNFGGNSIRSRLRPWLSSQKERQSQLNVNIMSNRMKVMLTKDAYGCLLELKALVKPETASSTRYTLRLSRLNISF